MNDKYRDILYFEGIIQSTQSPASTPTDHLSEVENYLKEASSSINPEDIDIDYDSSSSKASSKSSEWWKTRTGGGSQQCVNRSMYDFTFFEKDGDKTSDNEMNNNITSYPSVSPLN